jgi:hypothetical protein
LAEKESFVTKPEKGKGRIEKRTYTIIRNRDCEVKEWANLYALIEVKSERTIITTAENQTETRY